MSFEPPGLDLLEEAKIRDRQLRTTRVSATIILIVYILVLPLVVLGVIPLTIVLAHETPLQILRTLAFLIFTIAPFVAVILVRRLSKNGQGAPWQYYFPFYALLASLLSQIVMFIGSPVKDYLPTSLYMLLGLVVAVLLRKRNRLPKASSRQVVGVFTFLLLSGGFLAIGLVIGVISVNIAPVLPALVYQLYWLRSDDQLDLALPYSE
jgi:hypothetical protein